MRNEIYQLAMKLDILIKDNNNTMSDNQIDYLLSEYGLQRIGADGNAVELVHINEDGALTKKLRVALQNCLLDFRDDPETVKMLATRGIESFSNAVALQAGKESHDKPARETFAVEQTEAVTPTDKPATSLGIPASVPVSRKPASKPEVNKLVGVPKYGSRMQDTYKLSIGEYEGGLEAYKQRWPHG